jgi:hypothetical protein
LLLKHSPVPIPKRRLSWNLYAKLKEDYALKAKVDSIACKPMLKK